MDEFNAALELATEEELQQITQILFSRRFNPLDYWQTPEPWLVQSQDWDIWIDSLDKRFRYLAADGIAVLQRRTQEISYRDILIKVCHYLKIPYSQRAIATDIESDIFLHLVSKAWQKLPANEKRSLQYKIGQSLATANPPQALPVNLQHNPLKILLKGSSFLAVNSIIKPWLLKHIAQQFALHFARDRATRAALVKGGTAAMASLQGKLALQASKGAMAANAARYSVARGALGILGPIMWGYFIADLGWKAIATNHSRVIPIIFTLAQIRLIRGDYLATA